MNIPGISYSSAIATSAPYILVCSPPKRGKSTLACSLFGYPEPDSVPLVLAADPTGPDVCAKFGFQVPALKIKDMSGERYEHKLKDAVDRIERAITMKQAKPGSIMIDCWSTLAERLVTDAGAHSPNPDPRSHYNDALNAMRNALSRLMDLGVPLIGLSWLEESTIVEDKSPTGQKTRKQIMGGASIMGRKARALIAGKADMVLLLDMVKRGTSAPGADQDGYVREFRTKTYDNIDLGGRYALPDPCPANLGYILSVLTGRIQPQAK